MKDKIKEKAKETPIEDLRKSALEHYDKISNQAACWFSDIPKAINFYYDHLSQKPNKESYICNKVSNTHNRDIINLGTCRECGGTNIIPTEVHQEPLSDEEISKAFIAGRNSNDLYARLKGIPTSATEYLDNYRTQPPRDIFSQFAGSSMFPHSKPPKDEVDIDGLLNLIEREKDGNLLQLKAVLMTIEQVLKRAVE